MKFILLAIFALTCFGQELMAGAKKAAGKLAARERVISREGRAKAGSKTKINFEDESIEGNTKAPDGSLLSSTKANKDFDMVKIRTEWHHHMLESAASLDAGSSR